MKKLQELGYWEEDRGLVPASGHERLVYRQRTRVVLNTVLVERKSLKGEKFPRIF